MIAEPKTHKLQQESLEAWIKINPKLGLRQEQVYLTIRRLGEATSAMIGRKLGLPINCITGRVNELRKKNLVCCAKVESCPVTGGKSSFWRMK